MPAHLVIQKGTIVLAVGEAFAMAKRMRKRLRPRQEISRAQGIREEELTRERVEKVCVLGRVPAILGECLKPFLKLRF